MVTKRLQFLTFFVVGIGSAFMIIRMYGKVAPAAYQLAIFALCVSITMPSIEVLLASSLADAILCSNLCCNGVRA
jgi:hypothetical protein